MKKMLIRVTIDEVAYEKAKKLAREEGEFFNKWVGKIIKERVEGVNKGGGNQ